MRKLAATTTFSPSFTPSVISTKPSPRMSAFTDRGSNRPSLRSTDHDLPIAAVDQR
jgi:hypothetical protein